MKAVFYEKLAEVYVLKGIDLSLLLNFQIVHFKTAFLIYQHFDF